VKLETLEDIAKLKGISLEELKCLKKLSLAYCELTSLPESIGELTKLEKLYLHGNELSSLPESFGKLKNLKCLILDYNCLRSLPESFCKLKNLQTLRLVANFFSEIPSILYELKGVAISFFEDHEFEFCEKGDLRINHIQKPIEWWFKNYKKANNFLSKTNLLNFKYLIDYVKNMKDLK